MLSGGTTSAARVDLDSPTCWPSPICIVSSRHMYPFRPRPPLTLERHTAEGNDCDDLHLPFHWSGVCLRPRKVRI